MATLNTAQEIFDFVVRHLRQQNEKALYCDACVYRLQLENGKVLKCAAGCLIKDEYYTDAIEGEAPCQINLALINGIYEINDSIKKALERSGVHTSHENLRLIRELQILHDMDEVQDWEQSFQEIAEKHSLTHSPVSR